MIAWDTAVAGGTLMAVGVAAYAVNRLALAMQANTQVVEADVDELAAVAAAVGVYGELPQEGKRGKPTTRSSAPRATSASSSTGRAPVAGSSTHREMDPSVGREMRPTPTDGPPPLWLVPDRWLAWCPTCQARTVSGDDSCHWCGVCGDRR